MITTSTGALLQELIKYCHARNDEIYIVVLPMFVTNGTLLTKETAAKLSDFGGIFGISVDGHKASHNINHLNTKGDGTYKETSRSIGNIKPREYLGAAVTLTYSGLDPV
jgi:sulfatase maturation enzyme AslB (radical SAM superfamily)